MLFRAITGTLCALAVCAPAAFAAEINYYYPPTVKTQGTSTIPIAGAGAVVIQVLVNKDGTFKVQKVLKSTNPGDNETALDIARRSTYKPARRGKKFETAFYDFTLKFTAAKSVSSSDESSGGDTAAMQRMLRAGNYAGAKSAATAYLGAHPGDVNAQLVIGVADTFQSDYEGAVGAFDRAPAIPQNYKNVAQKAYLEYAARQVNAGNGAAAVPAAKRGVELAPSASSYNMLGTALVVAGKFDEAIPNLEKARQLGISDDPKQRAVVDANTVAAYLGLDRVDDAKKVAAEAVTLDPANATAQNQIVGYYAKKADAAMKAGKPVDAAAIYESAAAGAPPKTAVTMYIQAAFAYLNAPKPDNARAKADAEKALAIDKTSPEANYAEGIALANDGKTKDAVSYLKAADAAAKAAGNADLSARIQKDMKALGGG